ncbi:Palmitoyltransferase zdhhc13, partial [Tyrophagus putrescentiae]
MDDRCQPPPPEPAPSLLSRVCSAGMGIARAAGAIFPPVGAVVSAIDLGSSIIDAFRGGGEQSSGPDPILMDCMNRNFEMIQANAQAIAQNAELIDRNYQAVLQISQELQEAKNEILKGIEESTMKPILSDLKTFLNDFTIKSKELLLLNDDELIIRLENPDGFMHFLKELIKAGKSGNFHARLNDIINQNLAVPENAEDSLKFIMLFMLINGLSSYISMLDTLNAQYNTLIERHFDKSDVEEYNKFMKIRYDMYKDIGTGLIASKTGLIDRVIAILERVASVPLFADEENLINELNVAQETFKELKVIIANKIKSQFIEMPKKITVNPDFSKSKIKTPAKPSWIAKRKISYAVLYQDENTKKRTIVSKWSNAYRIGSKACPTVKIPLDPQRRTRVIYRKFDPEEPQMVAIISTHNATSFVDIDRDVFNIAKETSEDAVEEIEPYVKNGANINAVFEKARTSLHVAAASGNLDLVRYLIEHGGLADQFDRNGYTALHNAAWKGAVDFVQGAIEEGLMDVNVLSYQSNTPLHSAVLGEQTEVVTVLLNFPETDISLKNYQGLSALHVAAVRGYETIVESFLSSEKINSTLNLPTDNGFTPLHMSLYANHNAVAMKLLESEDIEVNVQDGKLYYTPLHWAVTNSMTEVAERLIEKGALVNVAGQSEKTALHLAIEQKDVALVKLLLENGADVTAQTADYQTPIHYSIIHYEPAILTALLEAGAPVNQPDTSLAIVTPLYYALQHELPDVVAALVAKCAKFDLLMVDGKSQLHLAAMKGDAKVVQGLIKLGADVNQKFYIYSEDKKVSKRALDLALENGHMEVAEILIKNKAKIKFLFDWENSQMDSINKPLSKLNLNEDQSLQMVKILKKEKKDYQATFTLLACRKGFLRLLNSLKDNYFGYRVMSCTENAIKFGQVEIIKNLSENNQLNLLAYMSKVVSESGSLALFQLIAEQYQSQWMNIVDSNQDRNYMLHLAAKNGRYKILKYIIDSLREQYEGQYKIYSNKNSLVRQSMAVYLDALNGNGRSPLILACEYNADAKVVEYLLNAGAKIDPPQSSGSSELYYAAKHGNLPSVKLLVGSGARVEQVHKNGYSPLAAAIEGKGSLELVKYLEEKASNAAPKLEIIKLLLSSGGNINSVDQEGVSLLHQAIEHGYAEIAMYLLENGADFNTTSKASTTPFSTAVVKDNVDVAKTLLEKGQIGGVFEAKSLDMLQLLVSYGADPLEKNQNGTTFFEIAIQNESSAYFEDILRWYLFAFKTASGRTVAHEVQTPTAIQYIANHGGNLNALDDKHETPLHIAVANGSSEVVKILLEQNKCANVGARNADNETAIDIAKRLKVSEGVVQLLEKVQSAKRVKRKVTGEVDSSLLAKLFSNIMSSVGNLTAGMGGLWVTGPTVDIYRPQNYALAKMNPFKRGSLSPSPNQYNAPEVNSTLLLLDVIARKVTGQQYFSHENVQPSQLDIHGYALNVTEQFDKTLQQIDEQFGYEEHSK